LIINKLYYCRLILVIHCIAGFSNYVFAEDSGRNEALLFTAHTNFTKSMSTDAAKDNQSYSEDDNNIISQKIPYFKMQYAGNIGLISSGVGTSFHNAIFIDINYGYYPGQTSRVHTFALKTSFNLLNEKVLKKEIQIYSGFTTSYSFTKNTYAKYPSYFPNSYYDFPNAIHFQPHLGIGYLLHHEGINNPASLFFEIGAMDYKLITAIRNKSIQLGDIINLCFGIGFKLK
jgi:hypothetical protein